MIEFLLTWKDIVLDLLTGGRWSKSEEQKRVVCKVVRK